MQINQFPKQYEIIRKDKAQNDVITEQKRSSSKEKIILDGITESVEIGNWVAACGFSGFIIGFFVCCSMCTNKSEGAFITWIIMSLGGAILGAVLAGIINKAHNNSVQDAYDEISNEKNYSERVIQEIWDQANREIVNYRSDFETEAQRLSVKYTESILATEIIEWMTEGFAIAIDAADRRSHVERINVPFSFNVYTNKITCNLGTYDFEIKRCANLTSPLEQTAIARAIATAIQLNITMKYLKDASGTDIVIDIIYSYSSEYVSIVITYTAPNGNYCSVRNW